MHECQLRNFLHESNTYNLIAIYQYIHVHCANFQIFLMLRFEYTVLSYTCALYFLCLFQN